MKWCFNTKYGLEDAVLDGTKTSTRREAFEHDFHDFKARICEDGHLYVYDGDLLVKRSKCALNQEIAVARRYSSIYQKDHFLNTTAGWNNKMFTSEQYLPDKVIITNIKCERLQDIQYDDIMTEGIFIKNGFYDFRGGKGYVHPLVAFEHLIKKVCNRLMWEANPYVICYDYKLKKEL